MADSKVRDEERDTASAVATESERSAQASQSRVSAHFEVESPRWETIYEANDVEAVIHQRRLAMALSWVDALRLPVGAQLLELGCGAGHASVALAERGFHVQATDVVDAMMERACERVQRAGLADRVRVERADAHELPYADSSFDLVIALGLLPWLHSPARATQEMARVLRPRGVLIATIGNRLRLPWLLDPLYAPALTGLRGALKRTLPRLGHSWRSPLEPPTHPLDVKQWAALLSDAGFHVVRATTFGFGPFTFLGRQFLPNRMSVSLDRRLQDLADRQIAVVRSTGAQHIALARKRTSREDLT
jgi:ubiquinone/menaquinone biosynthesis C-methylase UbiE